MWDIRLKATDEKIRETKSQTQTTIWWLPEGRSFEG